MDKKIIVLGYPGSGKSTLSKKLQNVTELPLYHLNIIWRKPDRSHISRTKFDQKLNKILLTDRWIIDGDYSRTYKTRFQSCDTIIFLDYGFDECINRTKERIGKARTDIPWTEQELDSELVKQVENHEKDKHPKSIQILIIDKGTARSMSIQSLCLFNPEFSPKPHT